MVCPFKTGSLKLSNEIFHHSKLFIGIDNGRSLTKVTYLHNDDVRQFSNQHFGSVTIRYALFSNDDDNFVEIMKWLKKNAYIPEDTSDVVHITGCRGYYKKEVVESVLSLRSEYVEEALSQIVGLRIALKEIGFDNLRTPEVTVEDMGDANNITDDRIFGEMNKKLAKDLLTYKADSSSLYPCLIQMCGSQTGFVYFNKEGKGEIIRCQSITGNIILGLGKCLLDTNNYSDIIELATKGNRANVDLQTKDVIANYKDTPYGIYPADMPIFPFGKSVDYNIGLEDYRMEDVAASIVAFYCMLIVTECVHICKMKNIPKVYLAGNVINSAIFKKEIKRYLTVFPPLFDVEMLDLGYSRALGAMLCKSTDRDELCTTETLLM